MTSSFDVHKLAQCIVKYNISRITALPHIIRQLTESADLPPETFEKIAQMEQIIIGGAAVSRKLEDAFNAKIDAAGKGKRRVRVDQIWGMTEAGLVCHSSFD